MSIERSELLLNHIQTTNVTARRPLRASRAWLYALVLGLSIGFLIGCSV